MSQSDDAAVARVVVKGIGALLALVLLGVGGCMYGYPQYSVYESHMAGKAKLAEAEYSKQVLVQDALARLESSRSLALAEIERAKGVSEANRIIGKSLEGNESYLHYLWIHNLEAGEHDVIYVPTEAGLPIFEAGGRFHIPPSSKPKPGEPGSAEHPDATSEHSRAK